MVQEGNVYYVSNDAATEYHWKYAMEDVDRSYPKYVSPKICGIMFQIRNANAKNVWKR